MRSRPASGTFISVFDADGSTFHLEKEGEVKGRKNAGPDIWGFFFLAAVPFGIHFKEEEEEGESSDAI